MPTDGYVQYQIPGQAGSGADSGKVPISNPNMMNTVPLTWDPNGVSSITISYWQGATNPPLGAIIAPVVIYPSSLMSAETLAFVRRHRPTALRRFNVFESTEMDFQMAIYAVILGATPFKF